MEGIKRPHRGASIKSRKRQEKTADIFSFAAVIVLASAAMLPLWWIIRNSLMTDPQIFKVPPPFFPPQWLFSNYARTIAKGFDILKYFRNTMIVVVPDVLFGTATAVCCAFAFARLRFRGKKFIFMLCVGSMLLPNVVTLIPLYQGWNMLGLVNQPGLKGFLPLILPYFCGGGAFNIFLLRQFMLTIPRELDEAAKIDGAGPFRIMTSIIVPSVKPAIIVVALLIFITLWNDLLQQTIYLGFQPDSKTIAIGLTIFNGALKSDYGLLMCATVMSFLPGLIFYLIGQKHFVEGIVLTGMKN